MVTGDFLLDNSPEENSSSRHEILLSPHLLEEYDSVWDQELNTASDTESFIQHSNNHLNIIIVSILLILGLTTRR